MPFVQSKWLIGSNSSVTYFVTPRIHVNGRHGRVFKFGPVSIQLETATDFLKDFDEMHKCDCKKGRLT